jgi:soluble lytic murein transglycosylase
VIGTIESRVPRPVEASRSLRWGLVALIVAGFAVSGGAQAPSVTDSPVGVAPVSPALAPSARPLVPTDPAEIWLVPDVAAHVPPKALLDLAQGVRLFQDAKFKEALPLVSAPSLATTPLAAYASYFTGLTYLNLARVAEARAVFGKLREAQVPGFLTEAAVQREAEAAVAQEDHAGAAKLYEALANRRTAAPDAVLLALAHAYQASGDRPHAAETFARLYYEFPTSDLLTVAATELDALKDLQPAKDSPQRYRLELGRAERLFGSKRYQQARPALEALQPIAGGDQAELIALRIAECDHYLHRYRQAQDGLRPYLDHASRKVEAQFFYLTATRELGDHDEYVRLARALVASAPDSSWAEEALNNLATHYIVSDDDDQADAVFRELLSKFPKGRHAERAGWKAGWFAYKHSRYRDAMALFETAAANFPHSDYRPAYLYWSARAREQVGDRNGAATVYQVVTADYLNSYYGRLARRRVAGAGVRLAANTSVQAAAPATDSTGTPALPPTSDLVRLLLSLGLYDQARDELLYAQRTWGDSPPVSATLGWVYNKQGDLRRGIVAMKRAYPQYMAAHATHLPNEVLRIIFPVDYWPLIKRYAHAHSLDPYLVAALINQESSFDAVAKSAANAIGLMQVLPSTGRHYARTLRMRRFSAGSLTTPEVNIQLGTAYFAELVHRFGGAHYALASYNAGENRVAAWRSDRPGLEADEFIDDIPFPETQGYVKKIIGSAEDYRRLYGEDKAGAAAGGASKASSAAKGSGKPKPKPAAPPRKKISSKKK